MISILIPCYDYDITGLVSELHRQATETYADFEILVMEDGSTKFVNTNNSISQLSSCKHIVLHQNIGRSAIRNRLADEAKFNHLLFMDCDAAVIRPNFVEKYLAFCHENSVVIGGTAYDSENHDPKFALRFKYGRKREATPATERAMKGRYSHFSTFNFMICKTTFQKIRFDEAIKGYGNEDTLFGYHIAELNCDIHHIDNPLQHLGLDNNSLFLKKTEEGIRNLFKLYHSGKYPFISKQSKLLRTFTNIEKSNSTAFFSFLYIILVTPFKANLLSKHPSLFIFDLYKLLYLCHRSRET